MGDDTTLAYGTRLTTVSGRLVRVVDRTGAVRAELRWRSDHDRGSALDRLTCEGATIDGDVVDDPLLGPAHAIAIDGRAVTAMSAIDWYYPRAIPAVAAPGVLPAGVGGALLDTIARLAVHGGVPALRYAGPYPTPGLFRALARSFRTDGDEATFTRDLASRASAPRADLPAIAIDFVPDPCERVAIAPGARDHAELRRGLERATIGGVTYARDDGAIARLVELGEDRFAAEIWFGDAPYARVVELAADGAALGQVRAIPACTSPVLGQAFPAPLAAALADLVAEVVPAPIAAVAHARVAGAAIAWADLGGRAAARVGDGFAVHAALWDRLAPRGLARLALAIAEALAPAVTSAVIAAYSRGA